MSASDRDKQRTPKPPAKPPIEQPPPDPQLCLPFPLPAAKVQPISTPLLELEDEPAAGPLLHDPFPDQFTKIPRAIEQFYGERLKDPTAWKIAEVMHDMLYGWRARGVKKPKKPDQRSYQEISRATGVPLRTIKRKVPKLVKVGLLEVTFRGGYRRGSSRYRMPFVSALPHLDRPKTSPAEFQPANQGANLAPWPDEGASPRLDQGAKLAPWNSDESAKMAPDQGAKMAPFLEREEDLLAHQSVKQQKKEEKLTAPPHQSVRSPAADKTENRSPNDGLTHLNQLLSNCLQAGDSTPAPNIKTTAWKPTQDDARELARFIFEKVGVHDEPYALKILRIAKRARSVAEVLHHFRTKIDKVGARNPPRGTGWFESVIKEQFGPVGEDGTPVDRQSVLRAAAQRFGGVNKVPYEFRQLVWESPALAAERLATWPQHQKRERQP